MMSWLNKLKYLITAGVLILAPVIVPHAQSSELKCLQRPLPGHPVELVDLHPSDKQYLMLKEIKQLQLILMEPGTCVNETIESNDGPWFRARVFVFKGMSASFSHRGVIRIEAGKFK